MKRLTYYILLVFLTACHKAEVPTSFTEVSQAASIYPDYRDVTIPVNIAPLTFEWDGDCDEVVARFKSDSHELVCGDRKSVV